MHMHMHMHKHKHTQIDTYIYVYMQIRTIHIICILTCIKCEQNEMIFKNGIIFYACFFSKGNQ